MKNNNYPTWLVPIEIAKELKEIGFNEPCHFQFLYYHGWEMLKKRGDEYGFITSNSCRAYVVENHNGIGKLSVHTWEQVFQWFREKKIYGNVNQEWEYGRYNSPIGLNYFYVINDCRKKKINKTKAIVNGGFDTYEEAREELVKVLIQTYKRKQL